MAQIDMPQEVIERIKQVYGYTDEEIAGFSPKQRKARLVEFETMKYKLIAEVIEAENCACRHRKGEKYVYLDGGGLLPSESTVRFLCAWAIAPVAPFFNIFYDRARSTARDQRTVGIHGPICEGLPADTESRFFGHI